MFRSLPKATGSLALIQPSARCSRRIAPALISSNNVQQQRNASASHAISNPTLAGIEKRWEAMPPEEQAQLWMQLRDRMQNDWHSLTLQEKKACMLFQDCIHSFLS
jgi:cytochrome c oxidase subunit 4